LSDVFISYSRHDGALVARLVEALQARGKDVWVDVGEIRDAEVFPAALRMAVEQSDGFLFVISPESVASRYCEQEVAHALELNKRIVPLLYRAVPDDAAPRPWAPARARGRPPPRLGRVPRCAPRRARARRADPQVAPWVRFARERHAFSPDGKLLATATWEGTTLWDTATWRPSDRRCDRRRKWAGVDFSPDGRLLALAVDPNGVDGFLTQQRKGEVQVWEVDSRRRTGPAIVPGTGSVFSVAFNHDGTLLATGSPGQLDLWDVATHAHHGKPMKVADDGVLGVAFDPSGRLVAEGGATGPVRVWRVADQQPAFPPPLRRPHRRPVHGDDVRPCRLLPRNHGRSRRNQAVAARHGSRLRRRAGRQPKARLSPDLRRSAAPGPGNRLQPGWQAARRCRGRNTRDAMGRRPGGVAPACLRDRRPKPDPRGMEPSPPTGSPVSRDLLGVAHSLKRSLGGVDPAQTIRNSRPTGPPPSPHP
jgi:TIR domain